jgi:hypothetical protein
VTTLIEPQVSEMSGLDPGSQIVVTGIAWSTDAEARKLKAVTSDGKILEWISAGAGPESEKSIEIKL